MRITYHISILVLICSLGGLGLALGLSHARQELEAKQTSLGWNSLALRDAHRLADNIRQWLLMSDLILAGGETYLVDGAREQTPALIDLAAGIRQSPLVAEPKGFDELVRFIEGNDARLSAARTLRGPQRDRRLEEMLGALDHETGVMIGLMAALQKSMQRIADAKEHELDSERSLLDLVSVVACLVYVVLVAVLWRWTAVTMVRPLEVLTVAADEAIRFDRQLALEEHGPSEVRRLTRSVHSCMSNLSEKVAERTTELARRQTELERQIAERLAAEDRLRHDALHDSLTGLPNRALLMDRLAHCAERVQREPDFLYAIVFMDLDNFKYVNDSLGHEVGDGLLIEVAARLRKGLRTLDSIIRSDDLTARLGGDEFVILLENISTPDDAVIITARAQEQLAEPFSLGDHEVVISSSVGIAVGSAKCSSPETLLRDADIAMYRAKAGGKAQYAMFDEEMHQHAIARLRMDNDLRRALENEQFKVHYQPIVSLATRRIVAFEALLRWDHPQRGPISPIEFIPVCEENGLIIELGQWVIAQACRDARRWNNRLPSDNPIFVNVNLSKRQVTEATFVDDLHRILDENEMSGRMLRLEITESTIMENTDFIVGVLYKIKQMGIELHMDDFGTGYSSLACIHRFPIDVLKIDREFIATMKRDPQYAAVVRAVTVLAHALDIKVTAEGIETEDQADDLRALECEYGQGYLYSRPVSAERAWEMIAEDRGVAGHGLSAA